MLFKNANNHFYHHFFTSKDKTFYKGIHEVVHKHVFLSKVELESPQTFIMAEYMIKSRDYLSTTTLDDFLALNYEFDIYRNDLNCIETIQIANGIDSSSDEEIEPLA
jgi:hypothetical protein